MGGTGSTRRLVVEDANHGDTITISEAVVRRLKNLPDEDVSECKETPVPDPPQKEPEPILSESRPFPEQIHAEVEDFYIQKLKELQERNAVLQKQTNDQFAKAVQEVENKFINITANPVCQDLQAKVIECYQANPNSTLNCSPLVEAFTYCVDRARIAVTRQKFNQDMDYSKHQERFPLKLERLHHVPESRQ